MSETQPTTGSSASSADEGAAGTVGKHPCCAEPTKSADEYIGLIKRQNVIFRAEFDGLSLAELDTIDCDGAAVMDAFPATGVVSVLAGMQLVKTMKLPLIGFFESEHIPMCSTVHNEQISYPARIYGNKTIVIFVCEFQLADEIVLSMVNAIFDFALRHRSPMIYTIEGMPTGDKFKLESGEEIALTQDEEGEEEGGVKTYIDDTKLAELHMKEQEAKGEDKGSDSEPAEGKSNKKVKDNKHGDKKNQKEKDKKKKGDKKAGASKKEYKVDTDEEETEDQKKEALARELYGDKIHYLTTSHAMAVKLRSLGLIPIVDGIITGISGGILARAPLAPQEVTALLAPTSTLFPSPQSAMAILKLLGQLLPNLTICMSDLEKLNEDLDKVTKSVLKNLPIGAKNVPPANLYT